MTQNVAAGFDPRLASSGPFIPEANFNPSPGVLLWVNAATLVPVADQNGSEAAPFSDINTAADELPNDGGVLMVVQGDYSAQTMSVLGASAGDKPVRAIGLTSQAQALLLRRATSNSPLALENMLVTEFVTLTGGFDLELKNCLVGGAVSCENLRLLGDGGATSGIVGAITLTGAIAAYHYTMGAFTGATNANLIDSIVTGASSCDGLVRAVNATFGNTLDCQNIDAQGCTFNANLNITGAEGSLRECAFSSAVPISFAVPGGVLNVDSQTYGAALAAGVTLTNGIFNVVSRNQFIDVEVEVPVLATGELDYSVTSLVGTDFEGLDTHHPIYAFPRADLATAGAGNGGMIGPARMVSLNNMRIPYLGATPGGPTLFRVVKL